MDRQDRTYAVEWSRPRDGERLRCGGLSPRSLVARLMNAVRGAGSVVIWKVTAENPGRPQGWVKAVEHFDGWAVVEYGQSGAPWLLVRRMTKDAAEAWVEGCEFGREQERNAMMDGVGR